MIRNGTTTAQANIHRAVEKHDGFLFNPLVDFLCLGGGALYLLLILALVPLEENILTIGVVMLWLTNLVNHPHFAYSYQIFYRDFRNKLFGTSFTPVLRIRYAVAGIAVPLILIIFFGVSIGLGDLKLVASSALLMGFLVGWHYVKQGYGMLMLDAVFHKRFFTLIEKKILLINAYAVWIFSWAKANNMIQQQNIWGIEYFTLDVPDIFFHTTMVIALTSTLFTCHLLVKKWLKNGFNLPINGVTAYVVSLYVWVLLFSFNPAWIIVIPALHSLQYMIVVWRYQLNRSQSAPNAKAPSSPWLATVGIKTRFSERFAGFVISGVALGALGFWLAPVYLDAVIPYDREIFGNNLFLFTFWITINVHHYFIDNVIWRRGNPDTQQFLFTR